MKEFKRIIGSPGCSNLGVVEEGKVYRGAQPVGPLAFRALSRELGIKTALSLRIHTHEGYIEDVGIKVIKLPLNVFQNISIDEFDKALEVMRSPVYYPLLIFCRKGHDRTGVVCACYRVTENGWSIEDAEEEMQSYGFNDLWFLLSASLRKYVAEYGKRRVCDT
jgi:tyrosine-protein phosphatase SIW14